MAQQTRHGLYGGPRGLYGSFSGKVEVVAVPGVILRTVHLRFTDPVAVTMTYNDPSTTHLRFTDPGTVTVEAP